MTTFPAPRRTTSFPPSLDAMLAAMTEGIDTLDRSGYPPQDIYTTGKDDYFIEMALAGFTDQDIEITAEDTTLTVSTAETYPEQSDGDAAPRFIQKGIAKRAFKRSFGLGQHMVVRDARLENGLLTIHIQREVPEEAQPRRIEISQA